MKEHILRVRESLTFNLIIISLAILSVVLLVYELSTPLSLEERSIIHTIDLTIAIFFLTDFLIGLFCSTRPWEYVRKNWPDLLASIPVTGDVARTFRFLRILRLVRVFAQLRRGTKATGGITKTEGTRYIYLFTIVTVVVLASAIAFFTMEKDVNPSIHSFGDALWWSVALSTSVGAENIAPITWEGRVISAFLMFFGVAVFGTVAGLAGTHFLRRSHLLQD